MSDQKKKIRGTREWAVADIDCCTGCPHGCRYCYARHKYVAKEGVHSSSQWSIPVIRREDVDRQHPLYPGVVMFPTTHDIFPDILEDCLTVVANLVASGNQVLLVSKPELACIGEICSRFAQHRQQILFRFTISAMDNAILRFWEPNAPLFEERYQSLQLAYTSGFRTSVSVEPMLEADAIDDLIEYLSPHVTHSIWLGKMNKIEKRVSCDSEEMVRELSRIRHCQSDHVIKRIYSRHKGNPLVRWKESIKEVVGLKLAEEPGLDS